MSRRCLKIDADRYLPGYLCHQSIQFVQYIAVGYAFLLALNDRSVKVPFRFIPLSEHISFAGLRFNGAVVHQIRNS